MGTEFLKQSRKSMVQLSGQSMVQQSGQSMAQQSGQSMVQQSGQSMVTQSRQSMVQQSSHTFVQHSGQFMQGYNRERAGSISSLMSIVPGSETGTRLSPPISICSEKSF